MQLAFILYKYFPFGGLQRDFMRIALECQQRGHHIRVYTLIWEGEIPEGFEILSERQIRSEIHLLHDEIISLFKMTPYFYRTDKRGQERLYSFDSLDTEIEFGILMFRKI